MAFPSDVPVAAVATPVNGDTPTKSALTQTVEVVPANQCTLIGQSIKANGNEEIIFEVKKRFNRVTPGTGAWTEVAL